MIFNRGRTPFPVSVTAERPLDQLDDVPSSVERDSRAWVSIDWDKAPAGRSQRQHLDLRRRPDRPRRGFGVQAGGRDESDGSRFRREPGIRLHGSHRLHRPARCGSQHVADD